jgi:hypothetical protein
MCPPILKFLAFLAKRGLFTLLFPLAPAVAVTTFFFVIFLGYYQ